jgi:hypothetical protein
MIPLEEIFRGKCNDKKARLAPPHQMTKNLTYLVFALTLLLTGCMTAGTHGSIKGYRYSVNKDSLQKAIMKVIKNNLNIYRDTSLDSLGSSPLLDHNDGGDYSAGENYYNDIKHYVTIKITSGQKINEYTFRYYGPDEEWKTAPSAKIFICYAHDKDGNGGSEGNGGVSNKMAKEFTEVFEKEFIDKVDNELGMSHLDTD